MADIRVRVGQQNSIKVISALSGQTGTASTTNADFATYADYARVAGIATNLAPNAKIDVTTLNVTGIATFGRPVKYEVGYYNGPNGIAYFNNSGQLVSGPNINNPQPQVNGVVLSVDTSGNPAWASVIDGGFY